MTKVAVCEECCDSSTYKPTFNRGGSPSATTHLRVKWTSNRQTAYSMAISWLAANRKMFNGLSVQSVNIQPIEGTDCWDVNVEYGYRKADLNVVLDYKFQTTGGTSHITNTYQNVVSKSCVWGLPPYNFGGAIGVNSEGGVDGVDIKTPAFSWSQTQAFSTKMVTWDCRKMLAWYTARVNNSPFMGFDAGPRAAAGDCRSRVIITNPLPLVAPFLTILLKRNFYQTSDQRERPVQFCAEAQEGWNVTFPKSERLYRLACYPAGDIADRNVGHRRESLQQFRPLY